MQEFLKCPEAEIVALADVFDLRTEPARADRDARALRDDKKNDAVWKP
jgi:hypothetical protein